MRNLARTVFLNLLKFCPTKKQMLSIFHKLIEILSTTESRHWCFYQSNWKIGNAKFKRPWINSGGNGQKVRCWYGARRRLKDLMFWELKLTCPWINPWCEDQKVRYWCGVIGKMDDMKFWMSRLDCMNSRSARKTNECETNDRLDGWQSHESRLARIDSKSARKMKECGANDRLNSL